ncbi:uncharacterized protein LOC121977670 isoform X1 [Zingiber officinale]|uniref:uncharacterized protein LOC121977670 isoform X1 n=1 Tax=Zingiber officinale TaxID=94328 RepID=UPI001C4D81C2|nr:uncharacterized protein LOC121977670 isoform X1 [Zingiber officinale]
MEVFPLRRSHSFYSSTLTAETGSATELLVRYIMSGRGRRITDEEINELISKLQALLPAESRRRNAGRVSQQLKLSGHNLPSFQLIIYVGVQVAQGDVQLHQELAPGGRRPQRPARRPDDHHGQQQPSG